MSNRAGNRGESRAGSRAFTGIGWAVMALGAIHIGSALLLYPDKLSGFARSGFGGLYRAQPDQIAPFWSVLFGIMVVAAGQLIWWMGHHHRTISCIPGLFLIGIGLVGGWYVPLAPFWVAAILGVIIVVLVTIRRNHR